MEEKKDFTTFFSRLFEDIDEERVRMHVENLRDEFPAKSNEQLCRKIIDNEAMLCGIIGAATGALPWPWSILGVAPDLVALIYKQSNMVLSIAYVYGFEPDMKERAAEVLGCIGASVGAVAGTYGIKKLVERRMEERLVREVLVKIMERLSLRIGRRFIPILGAAGGAFFNYGSVQGTGNMAVKYYAAKSKEDGSKKEQETGTDFIEDVTKIEEDREKEGRAEPDGKADQEKESLEVQKPEGADRETVEQTQEEKAGGGTEEKAAPIREEKKPEKSPDDDEPGDGNRARTDTSEKEEGFDQSDSAENQAKRLGKRKSRKKNEEE